MSGREAALFSRITYVIGPHSTITTKEGLSPSLSLYSAVLGLTHGGSRARRSELLRRRPWEGCTHTQESLLTLSKAPHGYVFAIEAKGERERCARSPSPLPPSCSKQPFLTISAEEGGRKGAVVMSDSVGA